MLGMRHRGGGHVKTEGDGGQGTLRVINSEQRPGEGHGTHSPSGGSGDSGEVPIWRWVGWWSFKDGESGKFHIMCVSLEQKKRNKGL